MSLTDAIAWVATVLLFLVGMLFVQAFMEALAISLTKDGHKPKFDAMDKTKPWKSQTLSTGNKTQGDTRNDTI